jgi:hypothetical protein
VLDRLGAPEDIVAAEHGHDGPAPRWAPPTQRVWGPLEILAVLGLTVGTFVLPVVGPLIGMVCAWLSTQWTRREKVVATIWALLPVVLLVAAALLLLVARSSEPLGVVPMPVSRAIPVPAAT